MFCLSPFCYVCLKNKEEFFNLNNVEADYMRLWDKLLYCMPEIEDIEDIPLFICRQCRRDLRIAYLFRKKFVENFQYVDNYIRQLTYVDKPIDGTEHADLCVTLVDCSKRFQYSTSKIKTETSECIGIRSNHNSVDYYDEIRTQHIETDDEFRSCSDTENIPLSSICNLEEQSTDISNQSKENSNQSFQTEKLCQNWETFKKTIESPAKRRKLDNSCTSIQIIDVNDIKDDDSENVTILENSVLNLQNNISSKETNIDRQVQNVSKDVDNSNSRSNETEEQPITNEKPAEYSTILAEKQNVQTPEENLNISSFKSYETNVDQQAGNSENPQISKLDKNNLQATCDNQHHSEPSSNTNTQGNVVNQLKTNTESSTAIPVKQVVQTKQCCKRTIQSDTNRDLKQSEITPADIHTRPDDSVTNALFQSIRNSDRTCACNANGDDCSSRPSLATSMYESDVIESEHIDDYVSDNDQSFQTDPDTCDYRQSNVYMDSHSCNVSSVYNTDCSDISSPDNAAHMRMFRPTCETIGNEHQFSNRVSGSVSSLLEHGDEARCSLNDRESSSTTLVHIKSVTSDVEDNYSNETVLYQENVQQDTGSTVENHVSSHSVSKSITNFSFIKAYLSNSTKANESIDTNTTAKDNSIDIAKTSISNQQTIDKSNEKNCDKHLNSTPGASDVATSTLVRTDTEVTADKCVTPEGTKKNVYTSIRKKIPRLIDLNGSIRKNTSSTFDLFTCNICNNKYSSKYLFTMHTEQAHAVHPSTSTDANIQQEILLECETMLKDSTDVTNCASKTHSYNVAEVILQANHETNSNNNLTEEHKCHMCDKKFNHQSLLECHLEKHASKPVVPLPDRITNRNIVHDEHLSDNIDKQYKCSVCSVQFHSKSLLACHLYTHKIRMSHLSRVNSSAARNSLSRYKIPHLNQGNRSHTTRKVESVDHHNAQCESTVSFNETLVNKHRTNRIDAATDTANLHSLTNNKIKQLLQHRVEKQHTISASDTGSIKNQTSKTIKHIDDKIHSKHTLTNNRCETKHTDKSVTGSSKKNDKYIETDNNTVCMNRIQENIHTNHISHSNNETGSTDVSDSSTETYSFTDAIEENMYRIHLGEMNNSEEINNNKQCTNQSNHSNEQLETESSNHYLKKINEKKDKDTPSATVSTVDDSDHCVTNKVIDKNMQQISSVMTSCSEQPHTKVTAVDKQLDKCPLCDKTFVNFNSLREHLIIQHKAYKKFQCTLCEKNFRQRCTLHSHMWNSHSKAEVFVCPVCYKNFSGKFPLQRHMQCHHGEKPFRCTICEKTFRHKDSVKTHMVLHTGVKAYKCPYCDKAFAFKGNMVKHVQTHTKEKRRYPCPLCDKDFSTNFILKQHMRVHTGERPHKCPICHRAFAVRQTMIQHISIHTDEKPFQCTICSARFKRKQHLRRHMYIHTEDKPYKCSVCNKEFRLKTELSKHIAIHCSTKKPYTCDICNIGYSSHAELYEHNFNIHYKKDIGLNSVS